MHATGQGADLPRQDFSFSFISLNSLDLAVKLEEIGKKK
jgi:hypothetical protein